MQQSLSVKVSFFIANLLGAIIYGWLLMFDDEPPNRIPFEIAANVIFGVGCAIMAWPLITSLTSKTKKKEDNPQQK
jgi:hypothetical protein